MNLFLAIIFAPSILAGVSMIGLYVRPLLTDKTNL
jgi:hypothetical protein